MFPSVPAKAMLSEELEVTLGTAVNYARTRRHEIITVEHLLYALLDDKETSKAIRLCGGDIGVLKQSLEQYLENEVPQLEPESEDEP
ncbi:MAG: hypothetical protein OXS40_01410, partial [Gammaproteobacteria bacterium]|nr:hypothetical protein [Gammaproteobacteria bacterium]